MRELDPAFSFAALVAGPANHLAIAACRALAEAAVPPFNPLYVQAGSGQGKTHLLQAIGALRASIDPRTSVRYVPWDDIAAELRAVRSLGQGTDLLRALEEAELLLLDDVQRLRDQPWCREGLVTMLEARVIHRRPTVLTSRIGPANLLGPDDPAARLLGGGLVVEIGPPDASMREEIIRRRAADAGIRFGPAVVDEVVGLPLASARDLLGAVNRLIAFQAVSPAPLDPSQARVLITGVLDEESPGPAWDAEVSAGAGAGLIPPFPPVGPEDADEFGSFLSEIVAGISEQVDRWRARVGDAILRWEAEGFHTARLHALLDQELPAQPEKVLERFETDVAALRRLADEVVELAPDLAEHEALRDPDQLAVAEQLLEQARTRGLAGHAPIDHLQFDHLIEGPSNRAAFQAFREAAAAPGGALNPLVLVGDSGSGKTHLLHGFGNALHASGVVGVVCLSAQALSGEVEEAIRDGRLAWWRRRFQWVGALLVDDVHLLAGHPAVQDVLLELMDQLLADRRQTVLTSALPLAELAGLAPQLLGRLAAGASFELTRPDREVRRGVVRQMLTATEAGEDAGVIDYLADRPVDSVRPLQIMVQRVLRAAESHQTALNLALARDMLEGHARAARPAQARPGMLGPTVGGARLREKLVEVWPAARERLMEDFR